MSLSASRLRAWVDGGVSNGDPHTAEATARQGVSMEQLRPKAVEEFATPPSSTLRGAQSTEAKALALQHAKVRFDAFEKRRLAAFDLVVKELDRMGPAPAPGSDTSIADSAGAADGAPAAATPTSRSMAEVLSAIGKPAKMTSAQDSALVQLSRQRAAKAAAAQLRYKLQLERTRAKHEALQLARESAAEEEAHRLAEKELAEEAERQRKIEEARSREAERLAEAEKREAALATSAAKAAAEIEANLNKHAQNAEERRKQEADAFKAKSAQIDGKIAAARELKAETLRRKWQLGNELKAKYQSKLDAHQTATLAFVEVGAARASRPCAPACVHAYVPCPVCLRSSALPRTPACTYALLPPACLPASSITRPPACVG
jgi:hypothetical protein